MVKVGRIGYVEEEKRWKAVISYAVDGDECREVVHHIEELHELQDLIERGPTFCAIRRFQVEYCGPKETIRGAHGEEYTISLHDHNNEVNARELRIALLEMKLKDANDEIRYLKDVDRE